MGILKAFGVQEGNPAEESIYGLALIYNIINNEISSYLKDFDLTPGKFNILMITKHQGKAQGISQVEISKSLIVTPSNMTKLIDKLEADGLVTRSPLPGDKRVNMMRITDKGSKLLDRAWGGYQKKMQELVGKLDRSQQKNISALLLAWLAGLQEG